MKLKIAICVIVAVAVGIGIYFMTAKEEPKETSKQVVAEDKKEGNNQTKEIKKQAEEDAKMESYLCDYFWHRDYDGGSENYEFFSDGTCTINGIEGEYEINGDMIKLVLDGIELNYSFVDKGKEIVINGLTYKGTPYDDSEGHVH